ncbi:thioredoxin family protein [Stenotrophomonas maltophilia]|uniref:thioredoxin family protein n=1 Tax=Stenotrophomonas maltophilia TaxID=40324 RepID=UPI0039C259C0
MNVTVPSWAGKVEELDATEFNRLTRSNTAPLLLYIGAPWCPPCTTMGPAVEAAAETLGDRVRFVKVNAATDSQLLNALKVASVPMLVPYDGHGQELARFLGALSARDLVRWVQTMLNKSA